MMVKNIIDSHHHVGDRMTAMKFKDYIAEHDLSYSDVGKAIGVSTAAAHRYATGKRIPQQETMQRIIEFSGGTVTPNDFYNSSQETPQ